MDNTIDFDFKAGMTDVGILSLTAFSRIHGIARCALRALETPAGVRNLQSVAAVLQAALDAELTRDSIEHDTMRAGLPDLEPERVRLAEVMHSAKVASPIDGHAC